MALTILIVINVLSIFICHVLAKKRGLKPVFWGVMGALFGPLAIPFAAFGKPRHSNN